MNDAFSLSQTSKNTLSLVKTILEYTPKKPKGSCKKTLQKLMYLSQEAGIFLGFDDYSIYLYGPYSRDLDAETRYLYSLGYLDINTKSDKGHLISIVDQNDKEIPPPHPCVKEVVRNFCKKSPADLELLATTLYAQRDLKAVNKHNPDCASVVDLVTKIKGSKFPKSKIKTAIEELKKYGYFKAL